MASTDFTLAQQRLAARRQSREAETQARLTAQHQSSRVAQGLSRLPYPLGSIGRTGSSTWNAIKGIEGTKPAFRVGQVDAELLDEELLDLLKGKVGEALKYVGSHVQDDWSIEILLALRAILFKLTIWDHDATYGAALQNLKFTDARKKDQSLTSPSKWQKALYGLFTVGGKYAWAKWENWLVDNDNGYNQPTQALRRLARISESMVTLHSAAAFASFLVFLVNGRYRTLLDRLLRLKLAPSTSQMTRAVSFEYLNRQLVWHAFTEFLLFVLPLIGVSRWRKWVARAWRRVMSLTRSSTEEGRDKQNGEFDFLPERTCAICFQDQSINGTSETDSLATVGASGIMGSAQTDITNPYETIPCGCLFCYVCIASRLEAEDGEGWTCLRCGQEVKECMPWSGDVIEHASKPGPDVTIQHMGLSVEPNVSSSISMPPFEERIAVEEHDTNDDSDGSEAIARMAGFEEEYEGDSDGGLMEDEVE